MGAWSMEAWGRVIRVYGNKAIRIYGIEEIKV